MTLNELQGKLVSIGVNSGGLAEFDLFDSLKEFFSQNEVQESMLKANRDRLYNESTTHKNRLLPIYANRTAKHKVKVGLPSYRYTYYETGRTHESLEVIPSDTSVGIFPSEGAPTYSAYLDAEAWGLTEEDFEDVVRVEMGHYVVKKLKEYLNG